MMQPRERVLAVLNRREPDRIPRFEIWIDGLLDELGQEDPVSAYANLGQDCVMMPTLNPPDSNAWKTGVDEWGRVWQNGTYVTGVVEGEADLRRYDPPIEGVSQLFDAAQIRDIRERYPSHCLIFGTHIGPFTAAYMAMGFQRFFFALLDDPSFVHRLLAKRTEWCIAMYQMALSLGADVLVLGDDAGHRNGPMISPQMWRDFVLPYHQRIVSSLDAPMIWHSDGNVLPLLPMAVEAGFHGFHGLEPAAGMDLAQIKRDFGHDLILVGNVDVRVLCDSDIGAVRREVERCLEQGTPGGGYMLASCNSIFDGMNPHAVAELFRYSDFLLQSDS